MAATTVESYQRLRGGPACQEITYGWYPPAKNIWKNYGVKSSYEQECLYRHGKSRFKVGENGTATPIAPTPVRMQLSPRPSKRSKSPTRALGVTREDARAQSAKVTPKPPPSPQRKRSVQSAGSYRKPPSVVPVKAWDTQVPATSLQARPASVARDTVHTMSTEEVKVARLSRVKSAPLVRTTPTANVEDPTDRSETTKPARVQSAQVHRNYEYRQHPGKPAGAMHAKVVYPRPFSASPVPSEEQVSVTPERPPSVAASEPVLPSQSPCTEPALSYEEQLEKYGWRMQVHGDPLKLKQPTILERKPFTVTIPDSSFAREGPKGHMQNWDTYFYNTIPRRRATFDVHQDWISEVIHAKRMELQKREGGIKYRYKNFSFVY